MGGELKRQKEHRGAQPSDSGSGEKRSPSAPYKDSRQQVEEIRKVKVHSGGLFTFLIHVKTGFPRGLKRSSVSKYEFKIF